MENQLEPLQIRPERPADAAVVREILVAAFPTPVEADLVDRLRAAGDWTIGLVAEHAGRIVGCVGFSPLTVDGRPSEGLGLAPLAVTPAMQRQGVGGRLVLDGLERLRQRQIPFVIVLGDPVYYGRLGFARASAWGLSNEYGVDDAFQVQVLRPTESTLPRGRVRYAPAFAELGT